MGWGKKDQELEQELHEIKEQLREILEAVTSGVAGSGEERAEATQEEASGVSPGDDDGREGQDSAASAGNELEEAKERIAELEKQLSQLDANAGPNPEQLEEEIKSLREKNKQLEENSRTAQADWEAERGRMAADGVEERNQLQNQLTSANEKHVREIDDLRKEHAGNLQQCERDAEKSEKEKASEIEDLKRDNADRYQKLEDASQKLEAEKQAEIERLTRENSDLSSQLAAVASSERIEDVIWPAFMAEESTSEQRERLKGELHADNPSALAVRLVADLFGYNANHKLQTDKKSPLLSSVHRLGESLFAWLSESDPDPDQVYEKGQGWADLLNGESDGVFKIEVPMIDCEFDRKTMVNYGSGSSSADVRSIQSWCVKDAEGRVQHMAEVTLT